MHRLGETRRHGQGLFHLLMVFDQFRLKRAEKSEPGGSRMAVRSAVVLKLMAS